MKAWLGIGITLAVVAAAVAAPWLAPVDPLASDFAQGLRPPGGRGHPLGTAQLGRALLARVLYGARLALFIGACTVSLPAVVGGLLGLVAGFVERWPSTALMRLADVQLSFPFILLAMTINAIVGLGLRNIILSLSAAGWVVYARVVRGEVLSVKERDFVQAAAALGVGRARRSFATLGSRRPRAAATTCSPVYPSLATLGSSRPRVVDTKEIPMRCLRAVTVFLVLVGLGVPALAQDRVKSKEIVIGLGAE